ncbi:MAG: glycoside hydrolase family 15 protein [Acuticoccus sp.]
MSLGGWLARQEAHSAKALAGVISARALRHHRPGFGVRIAPAAGSVLASPVGALWDPEPDYFYHWVRDAAVVMLAAAHLRPQDPPGWDARFAEYVGFSNAIATRRGPAANPWRATTDGGHARFLRSDAELATLTGDTLLGEPRVNADGTVDCECWSRPQFDGPALRALSCLAWQGAAPADLPVLVQRDLAHVLAHAAAPSIGPWEDPPAACTAFTLLAQRAALRRGGALVPDAEAAGAALSAIETALAALWCDAPGHIRAADTAPPGVSDAATLLGVLLDPFAPTFGVGDPRIAATLDHVETWSRAAYPIAADDAPLVGRWPQDVYFGGNPWLPTTLGLAELRYRMALWLSGDAAAGDAFTRAEAGLMAIARHLPDAGALPEQLDRESGAPASCRDLTWSHAALLSAADARRAALMRREGRAAGF